VAVVARDQVVDLIEVPTLSELAPHAGETRLVVPVRLAERLPGLGELLLVEPDEDLDCAEPPHPGERPTESGELRGGVGPEVPQPPADRLAGERIPFDVLRQRRSFGAVARSLRASHTLPHDRFALSPFHVASLPSGGVVMSPIGSTGRFRRTREQSPRVLTMAPRAVP
jgi:hypothetical protein